MAQVCYIISNELDYDKLICDDAGPQYAKSMGWETIVCGSLDECDPHKIYVIDNRIAASECTLLQNFILANPLINFVAKIVDPYLENKDHHYYQWLKVILPYTNVRLLSVYEPKELTDILAKSSHSPLIYIPYVYDENKELPLSSLNKRKNKVIISGAINAIYPFRTRIWRNTRRTLSRFFYSVLQHPGYAELNQQEFAHKFTHHHFIGYIAQYKFMLLCGSRCRIEFLKFNECAYAGCLPIGEAPTSYPDEIKELFYAVNERALFFYTLRLLWQWSSKNHLARLEKLRAYLRETRSAKTLNQLFASHFNTPQS